MVCGMLLDNKIINRNNIINIFLLAGDKFMPEVHYDNLDLLILHVVHLLNTKKELKNLNKQVIRNIFIEMNLIKLVFIIMLHMQIIKIY